MADSFSIIALVAATFLLAGFVKGVIGMGLPTVAMGLLGLAMTPLHAAAVLLVPSLVTNVLQMVAGPALKPLAKRFAWMLLGVIVGTFIGIRLLTGGASHVASGLLGAVLVLYGLIGLRAPRMHVPPHQERVWSPLVGFITGLITGATGVFVIPAVPYLSALKLEKEELIQTLGLSFTVSTIALGAAMWVNGALNFSMGGASAIALTLALCGMWLGTRARQRLDQAAFRRWFFIGLIALGATMVAKALFN
ncbi:MAG: sulfite exporter TauE/SafE family protein [Burkholderiaceae bacterium]